jgi:hypothetical protein
MVSFTLSPLYSWGKSPRFTFDRRLRGPQGQPGLCGEVEMLECNWIPILKASFVPQVTCRYTDRANAAFLCLEVKLCSRHYQKKKVVGLEWGPLSLVSTAEELLDRKVAAPV